VIRSENLRSGYIQDDVEQYLYELLPERDAVISEMEAYAAEHRVPIIGPAVARLLSLFAQVSGAKRIFEMGSAIGYSTIWHERQDRTEKYITPTGMRPMRNAPGSTFGRREWRSA
jgi:predicted O-methyltransferase YrrM